MCALLSIPFMQFYSKVPFTTIVGFIYYQFRMSALLSYVPCDTTLGCVHSKLYVQESNRQACGDDYAHNVRMGGTAHQWQTPLGGCQRGQSCSFTRGFEPATLDLTDVKSKILPLSYGYWSKILALEPTWYSDSPKLSLCKSVLKLSLVKSLGATQ